MASRIQLGVLVAAAVAALSLPAPPAAADSFQFGFGFRSGPPGHWRPHHHHRRHHHFRHHHHSFYGPAVVFVPRPPVIYGAPHVVYTPGGSAVRVVPSSRAPYRTADGRYCREYQATITVDGSYQPAYGTACLGSDGAWRIVD
jgi:hypothetical protein